MKNLNILFCCEKYCDANPDMGMSNSQHVLFGSLKHSFPEINFNIVYTDEIQIQHKKHIDSVLEKVCHFYKPNVLMLGLMMGPSQVVNPSVEVIKKLKNGLTTCFFWPDIQAAFGVNELSQYDSVADLHISHAAERNIENNKVFWGWTPLDPKIYFPSPYDQKDIPVSFIGSVRYQDRQQFLKHGLDNGLPIAVEGGQRERKLTPEQYASFIRKSKISLNFPRSPGGHFQLKGRVFEALCSNSMLLEEKGSPISTYFKTNEEYVEFDGLNDFVDKIKYYLSHDKEREQIAFNGHKAFNERFTARHFWQEVLDRINASFVK